MIQKTRRYLPALSKPIRLAKLVNHFRALERCGYPSPLQIVCSVSSFSFSAASASRAAPLSSLWDQRLAAFIRPSPTRACVGVISLVDRFLPAARADMTCDIEYDGASGSSVGAGSFNFAIPLKVLFTWFR